MTQNFDFYERDPSFLEIKAAFLDAVESFHKERGFTNDLFSITNELEISIHPLKPGISSEEGSAFTQVNGQKVILLKENLPESRKLFTAWHELSHHLFEYLRDGEFKAYLDDLLYGHPDWSTNCEEELCFESAALLLMPNHSVDDVISETGFSPLAIFQLSEKTGASYSAAIRRIVRRKNIDSNSIVMKPDGWILDSFSYGESRGKYNIIPRFKVENDHPLLTTPFQPLEVEKFSAPIPFKGGQRSWKSKCMAAIDQDLRKVIAFFVKSYPDNNQDQLSLPLF
ncbi:ImmA/IrrE family metallo-endopeptidase [Leptolyngbyaceae cyanobacterium CCMR0082]|uniref:ImmA/IrrE family metallo-endopeptidase n=1 Tax=Adonisia turfae CCMR0082 TaxID=2304604 RepID=A0A6M0S3J3_9CYAN|nr:ImmA/IrrE family metallo-endopeptidase [Adonisia turfae]MDV3351657.1 ImmA/IrrE family metallo-endopeptidase [Leptothoe sp. LEGE 181152]NEZ63074.1 ImmA/IrrE family metallo-endopeptidase [Adonisia turfae CCMR0082]